MSEEIVHTAPRPFVFVLMPFAPSFDDIYKFGIKGAADEVGAYAERVDEQIYTEGILDRIYNQINKADVIVADMTGQNPNVFYEVGYAHALGKIVLLLTQNTNDIPFDLKHRPHTVYAGKIDTLRNELTRKLEWAISESKKQRTQNLIERLEITILGVNVPEGSTIDDAPIISVDLRRGLNEFLLKVFVRNNSAETIPEINHVYLFSSPNCAVKPCIHNGSYGSYWIEPFRHPSNSHYDALSEQYRLPVNLPPLPPYAVEEFQFALAFVERNNSFKEVNDTFKLRLHSRSDYPDFMFDLVVIQSLR